MDDKKKLRVGVLGDVGRNGIAWGLCGLGGRKHGLPIHATANPCHVEKRACWGMWHVMALRGAWGDACPAIWW
ncbi:MAG: hypothetical protein L3J39_01510 [Verrucomicrobiales bacterium]|nr:hypothetical protein [Verrucomicrobiales bacterium]